MLHINTTERSNIQHSARDAGRRWDEYATTNKTHRNRSVIKAESSISGIKFCEVDRSGASAHRTNRTRRKNRSDENCRIEENLEKKRNQPGTGGFCHGQNKNDQSLWKLNVIFRRHCHSYSQHPQPQPQGRRALILCVTYFYMDCLPSAFCHLFHFKWNVLYNN